MAAWAHPAKLDFAMIENLITRLGDRHDNITRLCGAGLTLVPIPPINGKPTKAPTGKGWNQPRSANNPNGYSNNPADFENCQGYNFGLYHGASNTLALDLDDLNQAGVLLADVADIPLPDWLKDPKRVEIKSPKPNRGKLVFKLLTGFKAPGVKKFVIPDPTPEKPKQTKTVFELRCGNSAQDVIIGEHPDFPGKHYQLIGNPAAIPEAPPVLLEMLQHWDDWKTCFESALGIEQEPPKIAPRQPQQGENLPGWRNPILEFNQSCSVTDVLLRNGYRQKGKDRFIRPGSESGAPGAVVLRNCKDGIERVYSHGGDDLNDGYAHDAFDCMRLLEHGGDFNKALAWNPEITLHNQQAYRQEQAKKDSEPPRNEQHQEQAKPKPLFPLIRADKLTAKPTPIDWLLEDILERNSLNLLFGEPGAGKSLFALDWAFCAAAGMEWHGHRTQQTDVVVIAGEGHAGLARRLKALEKKYDMTAPTGLFISKCPADFMDSQNIAVVAETIKATCPNPGLVIIDTLHRNMTGDENSSKDIGQFISNIDRLLRPLGAAVLIVHHSGHGPKDRSRGSSSIRAAMDGEFSATKTEKHIILTCHKSKDFDAPKPLMFDLTVTELGWQDSNGAPLTSVYLKYYGESLGDIKRKLSARDDAILTSLLDAIAEHGVEPTAEIKAKYSGFTGLMGMGRKIVHIDHWRDKAYKRIDAETPDAKRKAFNRCRKQLFNLGRVVDYDDYWWPIFN
jgi:hypothetical protein